ncbi:hypothetical protein AQUCO_07200105v1 [Aquilegia coerulea]|uniref:FAF domain-containing protein n=1 Tax=Aquilegia coerulea TaxID=218851 RepID=A0A2G5CAC6_AQUCA|nr:hypothetical protein AQUCO_07200105v1 [Aquilegia coerulea]
MAQCASLKQIFETPLPPNPSLIESLSWRHQIKSVPPDISSLTEIFGELHFKDHCPCQHDEDDASSSSQSQIQTFNDEHDINRHNNHQVAPPKPPDASSFIELFGELCFKEPPPLLLSPPLNVNRRSKTESSNDDDNIYSIRRTKSDGNENHHETNIRRTKSAPSDDESSSLNVNLQLCTEGLGFESFDVDRNESVDDVPKEYHRQASLRKNASLEHQAEYRKLRKLKSFPPPISSIGGNGKPWLFFRSSRRDGRFILRQCRIPTHVFFNAYREDGRLRLHPVRPEKQSTQREEENAGEKDGEEEEEEGAEEKDEDKNDNVHGLEVDAGQEALD